LEGLDDEVFVFLERNGTITVGVGHLEPDFHIILGGGEVSHTHLSVGSGKKLCDFVFLEVTTAVLVESLEESSSDIKLGFNVAAVIFRLLDLLFSGLDKVSDGKFFNVLKTDNTITISVNSFGVSLNIFLSWVVGGLEGLECSADHRDNIVVIELALSATVEELEESLSDSLGTLNVKEFILLD